jgi:hypothetical protein
MVTTYVFSLLVIPLIVGSVSAQQDPTALYADLSFSCPVTTNCPQVCAVSRDDCPETLQCKNGNETLQLCADGSCAMLCDPTLTSPCQEISGCAPFSCASVITYYDACLKPMGLGMSMPPSVPAVQLCWTTMQTLPAQLPISLGPALFTFSYIAGLLL